MPAWEILHLPHSQVQYKAWVHYPQRQEWATFPAPLKEGYVLKVNTASGDSIGVSVFANAATTMAHPSGEITIAAKHGGRVLYREKIMLKENQGALAIATNGFPAGICSITLYDEQLRPNAERLVYIQDHDPAIIHLTANKAVYSPKKK